MEINDTVPPGKSLSRVAKLSRKFESNLTEKLIADTTDHIPNGVPYYNQSSDDELNKLDESQKQNGHRDEVLIEDPNSGEDLKQATCMDKVDPNSSSNVAIAPAEGTMELNDELTESMDEYFTDEGEEEMDTVECTGETMDRSPIRESLPKMDPESEREPSNEPSTCTVDGVIDDVSSVTFPPEILTQMPDSEPGDEKTDEAEVEECRDSLLYIRENTRFGELAAASTSSLPRCGSPMENAIGSHETDGSPAHRSQAPTADNIQHDAQKPTVLQRPDGNLDNIDEQEQIISDGTSCTRTTGKRANTSPERKITGTSRTPNESKRMTYSDSGDGYDCRSSMTDNASSPAVTVREVTEVPQDGTASTVLSEGQPGERSDAKHNLLKELEQEKRENQYLCSANNNLREQIVELTKYLDLSFEQQQNHDVIVDELTEKIEELEKKLEEGNAASHKFPSMERENSNLKKMSKLANERTAALEREVEQLKKDHEELTEKQNKLKELFDQEVKENQHLDSVNMELRDDKDNLNKDLDETVEQLDVIAAQRDQLQLELKRAQTEAAPSREYYQQQANSRHTQQLLEQKAIECDEYKNEIGHLRNATEDLRRQLARQTEECNVVREQSAIYRNDFKEERKAREGVKGENDALKKMVDMLRADVEAQAVKRLDNKGNQKLRNDIDRLKRELNEAKQHLNTERQQSDLCLKNFRKERDANEKLQEVNNKLLRRLKEMEGGPKQGEVHARGQDFNNEQFLREENDRLRVELRNQEEEIEVLKVQLRSSEDQSHSQEQTYHNEQYLREENDRLRGDMKKYEEDMNLLKAQVNSFEQTRAPAAPAGTKPNYPGGPSHSPSRPSSDYGQSPDNRDYRSGDYGAQNHGTRPSPENHRPLQEEYPRGARGWAQAGSAGYSGGYSGGSGDSGGYSGGSGYSGHSGGSGYSGGYSGYSGYSERPGHSAGSGYTGGSRGSGGSHESAGEPSSSRSARNEVNRSECPMCFERFSDFAALKEHTQDCAGF